MSEIAIGTAAFIAITVFAACGIGGEPESNATINEAVMRDTATAALSAAQITVAGDARGWRVRAA
jgi:hypothetical protein